MTDREQVVLNGRYELHRRVGRGGMAEVYLARDRLLDRLVAIKILFPEFATDPSFVARFRREAQAAANLNHPNIVGVYDWGKERGTYYIVMEYVDGRSVSDMIRTDGPLEPKKAAAIAADVAGALGFAHRKGVVHRDVKPGNVLITKAGEVKVADFGIARAMAQSGEEDLTQTGSVMGTATYFSPEQAQGKPVDARTDLYSLGVVLYEMVAGKPPFSGDSPVAIAYQHVQEPIPPLSERAPGVPAPYEAIAMRALAKDADARYPDGAAMRADLLRFRDGRPISPGPAAAAGAAGAVAGAVVAGAAAGATTAVPSTPGPSPAGPATSTQDSVAPNKRTGWFFVVIILLMVILGGLLVVFGNQLGIFDQQTKSVTMPRVVDTQEAEATQQLEALKLVVDTAPRESEEPEGTVLEQSPAPGDQVDEGSTVVLTVSVGIGPATVPQVSGLTELQATEALTEAGFTNFRTESEETEDLDRVGFVLRSDPIQGAVVAKNTRITLFVATALAPTTTAAPVTTTSPPTTAAPTTTTSPPATTTTTAPTTTTTGSTTTTTTPTSTTVAP